MASKTRKKWKHLDVSLTEHVMKAINSFGFVTTTPVQAAAIPLLLNMKDVPAEAVTGTYI